MQGTWVRKPSGPTSVVFIHGILSDSEACWRHKSGSYWPGMLAQEDAFNNLGVYVFTYKTNIFSGSYRLGDVVDSFKEHAYLDGVFDSPTVILVCHSMGGIVARKFITTRATDLVRMGTNIGLFLLASPSLGSTYANWLSPLAKFLGHRGEILEIILSCIGDLRVESAEMICATFSNLEREALARLAIGTLVDQSDRPRFLSAALVGFSKAKSSTIALRALSKHAGSYAGQHLREIMRAAVALAEGIGDVEELRIAYANASIEMPDEQIDKSLKADFWHFPDSMPVEKPLRRLPRAVSLTRLPFWHAKITRKNLKPDVRPTIDSTTPKEKFLTFAIAHLSTLSPDTTRAETYDQLADLAQEFVMRGMHEYASVITDAMFDTAIMYR